MRYNFNWNGVFFRGFLFGVCIFAIVATIVVVTR